jgi:hypothetical protein
MALHFYRTTRYRTPIRSLKVLFIERAAGLHAGRELLRDTCIFRANAVSDFLRLLATSQRIRPYLEHAPRYPDTPLDRTVLLEEPR